MVWPYAAATLQSSAVLRKLTDIAGECLHGSANVFNHQT